jgi:signal transduction histidine kinase
MDNGIGIPKEHLEKIWYVFYRVDNRHVQGDGIGLSVVKRIVEKHNGRIWVESTERYGTTFFIELPAFNFSEN